MHYCVKVPKLYHSLSDQCGALPLGELQVNPEEISEVTLTSVEVGAMSQLLDFFVVVDGFPYLTL